MASNKEQKLKIAIAVLSVLLAISLTLLAGLLIYLDRISPLIIPDNMITTSDAGISDIHTSSEWKANLTQRESKMHMSGFPSNDVTAYTAEPVRATEEVSILWSSTDNSTLRLYEGQEYDETAFLVKNMFPGDAIYKEYKVEVSHRGVVDIHFDVNVRPTTDPDGEKLEEVLGCKIEIDGTEVYDGLMRDVPDYIDYMTPNANTATTTGLVYKITAYLDGPSVGNEYMNKTLIADFRWFVEVDEEVPETQKPTSGGGGSDDESEKEPTTSILPTDPITDMTTESEPEKPEGELVKPSKTGDNTVLVFGAALAVGILLILLIIVKRRKEDEYEA